MKALIQRVKSASVSIDGVITGQIGQGLLVLLGISHNDTEKDIDFLVKKITNLRIFEDEHGKMNLSVQDTKGSILIVSQFTLYADTQRGNRPSFTDAAKPEQAIPLYELFIEKIKEIGIHTETGVFGADMQVSLINDGPVTIMIESR